MKHVSVNVDSNIVFVIINNVEIMINAGVNAKKLIDKGVCDKGFIWNPSNCECECYKSCDISECLDYKNCKCKKRLVDKLVGECTENINETRLVEINSTECNSFEIKCKHNSCTLNIVLFSILFTINVGIGAYFAYKY